MDQLSVVLAEAFAADPVSAWLFPRERGRARRLARYYRVELRQLLEAGDGFVTDDLQAASIWLPMGRGLRVGMPRPSLSLQLWLSLRAAIILGRRLPSALALQVRLMSERARVRHWYLAELGTAPSRQGQGLGTAVLAPGLRRCDETGLPAILHTATEVDVRFYQHRGFRVVGQHVRAGQPLLWTMERQPMAPYRPEPSAPGAVAAPEPEG